MTIQNKLVLLDRDGVINRLLTERGPKETPVIPDEFELLPQVKAALALLRTKKYSCAVVTNQPNIAKGKTTPALHQAITKRMHALLGKKAAVDALYECLHHPTTGTCTCRKPKPGLLLAALRDFNVAPANAWLVGDSDSDIEAGSAAGLVAAHLIAVGTSCSTAWAGICRQRNLWQAAQYIITND